MTTGKIQTEVLDKYTSNLIHLNSLIRDLQKQGQYSFHVFTELRMDTYEGKRIYSNGQVIIDISVPDLEDLPYREVERLKGMAETYLASFKGQINFIGFVEEDDDYEPDKIEISFNDHILHLSDMNLITEAEGLGVEFSSGGYIEFDYESIDPDAKWSVSYDLAGGGDEKSIQKFPALRKVFNDIFKILELPQIEAGEEYVPYTVADLKELVHRLQDLTEPPGELSLVVPRKYDDLVRHKEFVITNHYTTKKDSFTALTYVVDGPGLSMNAIPSGFLGNLLINVRHTCSHRNTERSKSLPTNFHYRHYYLSAEEDIRAKSQTLASLVASYLPMLRNAQDVNYEIYLPYKDEISNIAVYQTAYKIIAEAELANGSKKCILEATNSYSRNDKVVTQDVREGLIRLYTDLDLY